MTQGCIGENHSEATIWRLCCLITTFCRGCCRVVHCVWKYMQQSFFLFTINSGGFETLSQTSLSVLGLFWVTGSDAVKENCSLHHILLKDMQHFDANIERHLDPERNWFFWSTSLSQKVFLLDLHDVGFQSSWSIVIKNSQITKSNVHLSPC